MTAAGEAPEILLRHHLKKLKLPTVLREYEKLARQCAAENVDHVRYLVRLIELELLDREARTIERRIRDARFPAIKSLETFDFDAIPSLNKKLVLDLARCEFVARRGIDVPQRALRTLHAVTQRFTAEWAIRPFIVAHPALAFATLQRWTADPSAQVRRLVEGDIADVATDSTRCPVE